MDVDEEEVPPDDDDANSTEEDRLLRYVRKFMEMLSSEIERERPEERTEFNRYHSVLCYGRNTDRLRLLSYVFATQIGLKDHEDAHLIRVDYLPDLIRPESAFRLISNLEEANYLEFLKIYYLPDSKSLIDHLLGLDNSEVALVPGAIIVDDLSSYVLKRNNPEAPAPMEVADEAEPNPDHISPVPHLAQFDLNHDRLYTVFKLCSALIETASFCGRKLDHAPKQKSLLLVTIDLNNFQDKLFTADQSENIPDDQNPLIQQICERFFQHQINADKI